MNVHHAKFQKMFDHREHTILLSRETKYRNERMNTCSAKLVPRPFRAQQKKFYIRMKFDKGGNSLPKHFERSRLIGLLL